MDVYISFHTGENTSGLFGLFQISYSKTEEVALQINQNLFFQMKCLQAYLVNYQKCLSEIIFGHVDYSFI